MPKDFTGVRPLGVVTKHPADWFSDSLYVASFFEDIAFVGSGLLWHQFGLLNQDQGGNVLRVYGKPPLPRAEVAFRLHSPMAPSERT